MHKSSVQKLPVKICAETPIVKKLPCRAHGAARGVQNLP